MSGARKGMFGKLLAGIRLPGRIAAALSACDADKLNKLRPGRSSADEVRQILSLIHI